MRSQITPSYSLNNEALYQSRKGRLVFLATLLFAIAAFVLTTGGWHQSTSAQELLTADSVTVLPGDLDLSFGIDGTVATDLGNNLNDSATAVAVQPDGKVLAAGYVSTASAGREFAVIRLNPNGTLDTTFANGGRLSFNFNSANRDDIARAIVVQPDGRIVVAGEADVSGFGNFDIVLARLNGDGTFDTGFGSGGKVTTNLPNSRPDYGRALALQPDGKILVAGYSNRPTTGDDFVVARYNANGSLDTTFDGDGILTTDILTNREDRASSIALQSDGRIIIAGYTSDPSFKDNFAVVRYNTNGSLDSGFGGTGKVTTDLNLNSDDFGNGLTVQGDGKVIVAGQSGDDFGLVRYNPNGTPDTGFGGGDGIVTTNFGSGAIDIGRAVVVQSNGKITIAGRSRTELAFARYDSNGNLDNSFDADGLVIQNAGNNYISPFGGYSAMALQADGRIVAAGDGWRDGFANDFTVSRLNPDGTFDLNFGGGDGIASTDINGRFDEARAVAMQADGKIVVAGSTQNSTGGFDFALARYNRNGTPDTSFGNLGRITTDINGHNNDHGYAVALQSDGKILVAGYTNNAADGLVDDAVLLRYNSNGAPDTSFASGGVAILAHVNGLSWLRYRSIALQSDGKIVVAGEAHYFSAFSDGLVARYNTNGTLDSSFGGGTFENPPRPGVTIVHFASLNTFNAVQIQADGKAVAAGSVNDGAASDFALARLNLNGTLDTTFDGDGKLTTNFSNSNLDAAYDLAIQPDGKLIAVGETVAASTGSDFGIARYNSNGSLDTTFAGGTGMAHIDFFNYRDYASAVALQPDGKIILTGLADDQIPTGWGVVKLNQNGTLDTTFGGGSGRVRTLFGDAVGSALEPAPFDGVLQQDGKIVMAGRINLNSTDRDITVVRYENSNAACTYSLGSTGAAFTASGGNGSVNVTATGGCNWTAVSNNDWITITSGFTGSGNGMVTYSVLTNSSAQPRTGTITVAGQSFTIAQEGTVTTPSPTPVQTSTVGLSLNLYTVNEGDPSGILTIMVNRTGDVSTAFTVGYATGDQSGFTPCQTNNTGFASDRCDYATAIGTLRFAAGETSKTIQIPIINDGHTEPNETFTITLRNLQGGATIGTSIATISIVDNDPTQATTNPVNDQGFFIKEQYIDFLGRVAEPAGFDFWMNRMNNCPAGQICDRIDTSKRFFESDEFNERGFYVYRLYDVSLGKFPLYAEFVSDVARLNGFQTVQEQRQNKDAYLSDFMKKVEFRTLYGAYVNPDGTLIPGQAAGFVNALAAKAGITPAGKQTLIDNLANGTKDPAHTLEDFILQPEISNPGTKFYDRARIVMQYFGYLRRDPEAGGFDFWWDQLTNPARGHLQDYRFMVGGFLQSDEYRFRFASTSAAP
jgi:uncharacterized delta-60 repeat protein